MRQELVAPKSSFFFSKKNIFSKKSDAESVV